MPSPSDYLHPPQGPRSAPWPLPDDVSIVQVEDYPLVYTVTGEGDPVLLVHGSLNDYRSWAAQVPAFAARHRVIAVSLRHYFPEPWDGSGDDFSLLRHAADLKTFLRALDTGPVHLVGHSRGGAVAYLLARDAPELVRSLVLAEPRGMEDLLPPGSADDDTGRSNQAIFAALHNSIGEGRRDEAAERFIDAFNGPGSWQRMPARQKTIILDNIATAVDTGELPGMRAGDIARFAFPVLPVRGELSLPRYARGFEAMRACNPRIRPDGVIPGAPHGMHRINPEAFNAAVLAFLAEVP